MRLLRPTTRAFPCLDRWGQGASSPMLPPGRTTSEQRSVLGRGELLLGRGDPRRSSPSISLAVPDLAALSRLGACSLLGASVVLTAVAVSWATA